MLGISSTPKRLLVYDLETYATGFADPQWVPQVITCVAWKWLGEERVWSRASIDYSKGRRMPHLQPEAIERMLKPFLKAWQKADGVVTYNGRRFDNPVLNGSLFYIGFPPLGEKLTYDLHEMGKVKGVKKGLDNISVHMGSLEEKLALNHAQWTVGYLEERWVTIKERAQSDVLMTELLFYLKDRAGWLKPPKMWTP